MAASLSPLLHLIAKGELGAAALHEWLAVQGHDTEPILVLAGQRFISADVTIIFGAGSMSGVITFEDTRSPNAFAIVLRRVVPPPLAVASPLPPFPRQWRALAGALIALGILLGYTLGLVTRPRAEEAQIAPLTTFADPRVATLPPPTPTSAPPTPTSVPSAPAPILADSFVFVAQNPSPPPEKLLRPAMIRQVGGWAFTFFGESSVQSFPVELGDPAVSQQLLVVAVQILNRTGVDQPFPDDLLVLAIPGGPPLRPNVELSQRYALYNTASRLLASDVIPGDGSAYTVVLAFDVPPNTTGLLLYHLGDPSGGWLVR